MSNSAIRTNGCDKLIFSNLVARLQRYPLVIVGESMKVFIRRMSKDDLEGSNENRLCFTGGKRTVVKKSLIHLLGMAVFVSSNVILLNLSNDSSLQWRLAISKMVYVWM